MTVRLVTFLLNLEDCLLTVLVLLATDDSEVALELVGRLDLLERENEVETKRVG